MQAAPTVEVEVDVPVRPTEDPDKVEEALLKIFPEAKVERRDDRVVGRTASIETLLRKTGEERVRDAARGALWRGRIDDGSTRFELSKQAAFVGRVNFNEVTHPLGDLGVTIRTRRLEDLLDAIAPPTRQELAARERAAGNASKRAALHDEERDLAAIGSDIDTLWDEVDEDEAEEGIDGDDALVAAPEGQPDHDAEADAGGGDAEGDDDGAAAGRGTRAAGGR